MNQIINNMGTISINGVNYSGNNIIISNGKVVINGKDVTPDSKEINIKVEGNIDKLVVDSCIKLRLPVMYQILKLRVVILIYPVMLMVPFQLCQVILIVGM